MPDREKVIDGLERLRFFNQRAGRELWQDKPYAIQQMDIANADAVYADALALLKEQDTVEHALEVLRKAGWTETHDVPFPAELLKEQEAVMPNVSSVEQRCGNCNKVIEMDGWKTCPWCGKPIDWERWWHENTNGVRHDGGTD